VSNRAYLAREAIERVQEKWPPVFRPDTRQIKNLERDGDSRISHPALNAFSFAIGDMDKKEPLTIPVRESAAPKRKRIYKTVSVGEGQAGTYAVLLDGKPALTPLRTPLAARARALADGVAAEWDAQDPHVDPETMPLTRLLATQIDRIVPQRDAVIASLLTYVDADTICFRAQHPADLLERQQRVWQPVMDWLRHEHGIALTAVEGLMPAVQGPGTLARMRQVFETFDDTRLTAFQAAASLASSLALGLALVHRRLSAADAFAAAFLDELYQVEKWGEDDAAKDRRRRIAGDLAAIERYLDLSA
jgi:chaperone required for assembly of F1-ATPase